MAIRFLGDEKTTEVPLDKIEVKKSKIKFLDDQGPLPSNVEKQNWIGSTFNVPAAAIRSMLQDKGYSAGMLNPSKVEKFQDIAIRKAQFTSSPYLNIMLGMPASALGMAADIVTNPADIAMTLIPMTKPAQAIGKVIGGTKAGKAISSTISRIGQTDIKDIATGAKNVVTSPIRWVKDMFSGIKKAKDIRSTTTKAIKDITNQNIEITRKQGLKDIKLLSQLESKQKEELAQEANSFAKALQSAEGTYKGRIEKEAFLKSEAVRKKLPQLFKDKSAEYGEGLRQKLLEKPVSATQGEVIPVLEESLLNHGILGTDDAGKIVIRRTGATKAESQILTEYLRLRDMAPTSPINTGELLQSSQIVRPKYGKVWSPSEHLQSEVSEGLSELVALKSPEVAAYRKAYAPFLQWKKAVIKEFQPFAGKYANKKGTQILSKYADINKRLSQDEVRLISELEKQTGEDITSGLKQIRGIGREIESRKEGAKIVFDARKGDLADQVASKKSSIDEVINRRVEILKDQRDLSIDNIEQETKDIIDALQRRRLIVGGLAATTLGASFINYIKNRLTYSLFGLTSQ